MAGYLMKKHPLDNCSICKEMYKLEELPQSSPFSDYELLRFKRYTNMSPLVFPTPVFTRFVQTLEDTFCSLFGGMMHMTGTLKILVNSVEKEVLQLHKCDSPGCLIQL